MFARQWFSHDTQLGLTPLALELEDMILNAQYSAALNFICQHTQFSGEYWRRQTYRVCHLLVRRENKPLTLFYDSFWPGMVPGNCQLTQLFCQAIAPHVSINITSNPADADISLYSCYGHMLSLPKTKHTFRVLFLGENVRPTFTEFDLCLSSDLDSYSGRNLTLPLWMFEIDWFGSGYPDRDPKPLESFTSTREFNPKERPHAIAYIGNNCEPFRLSLMLNLERMGYQVDRFGSQSKPVDNKNDLLQGYRIALCPENSYYPGYTTEKLFQSYLSGAFSIYSGNLDKSLFEANAHYVNLNHQPISATALSRISDILLSEHNFIIPPLISRQRALYYKDTLIQELSSKLRNYSLYPTSTY